MLPTAQDLTLLAEGRHPDPFAVLGPHLDALGQTWVTTIAPGARWVEAETDRGSQALFQHGTSGIFRGNIRDDAPYRLRITWGDGSVSLQDDPYSFGLVLGPADIWHLAEGTHLRPYEVLGAHPRWLGVTCSVGIATFMQAATDAAQLIAAADQMMYEIKRGAKNGVRQVVIDGDHTTELLRGPATIRKHG